MSRASTPWLLAAIKQIERTGEEAQRAIGEGLASIEGARERLLAGVPVSEIVADLMAQGGREARLRSSGAIEAFEHAVMRYRVGLIRSMVDEEELSFAEVARRMGVSRQMIARLYRYEECSSPA
jgi:transcriptional regulator with XRE-family HTH domain